MLEAVYKGTGTLTWSSSDPSVATVKGLSKNRGYVTAKGPGTAVVTVTDGVVSRSCQVTVTGTQLQYPLVYQDETVTITITKEWYKNAWCYAAHLQFTDYTRFSLVLANDGFMNGFETTSAAAKRVGAVFAVNGPNMGHPDMQRRYVSVVSQGKIYKGGGQETNVSAVYSYETGLLLGGQKRYGGEPGIAGEPVDELVEKKIVTDTFHFLPPLLVNGKTDDILAPHEERRPRTFMGTNGTPGDLWIVVSEGDSWDNESEGLTFRECAEFLMEKECVFGISLDGGRSSAMYFQGQVLNSHSRMEREVTDFVCFK